MSAYLPETDEEDELPPGNETNSCRFKKQKKNYNFLYWNLLLGEL